MLILYDYWRSSAAYRVRIGLKLKGAPFQSVPIDLKPGVDENRGEAYRRINPQMRVPALKTDHGVLTQSLAILDWLDRAYAGAAFYPTDPWLAAQARAFALTIACDMHPLGNSGTLTKLRAQFRAGDDSVKAWQHFWLTATFEALESLLARSGGASFCFGDAPSIADICLVPQCFYARRFAFDLSPYPLVGARDEAARGHPAFSAAAPENAAGAPPP